MKFGLSGNDGGLLAISDHSFLITLHIEPFSVLEHLLFSREKLVVHR